MARRRLREAAKSNRKHDRAFSKKELERLSGEKLPNREAMSAIVLLGGPIGPRTMPEA